MFERERTKPYIIRMHCIYIFLESLRNTTKAIRAFEKRSYVAIWLYGIGYRNLIQKTSIQTKRRAG
jgi:hypothetical protein